MSVKNWKERQKEQRRDDILDAAEELFFKKGYDDISMRDISKEVGMGKSSLYFYFASKEALFFAIVLRGARTLNTMIKNAVKKEKTNIKKLSAFKDAYNTFTEKYPGYYWAYKYFQSGRFDIKNIINMEYTNEIKTEAKQNSAASKDSFDQISHTNQYAMEIIELRREIFATVYNSIENGITEGEFRPDLNPAETAVILTIISEGAQNIQPDLIRTLENYGINEEKFKVDSRKFIAYILLNK